MPDYFVYGGCLRSELTFPELAPAQGQAPNWTLRVGGLSRDDGAVVLSDVELSRTCRIRLTCGDGWFRYSNSCAGSFEIFANGSRILFEPAKCADLDAARADFVSRVLLYCVDHTSITWLQGSAVRIGGTAVAFVGPPGSGKSTIALAMARGGASHICDDTVAVDSVGCSLIRSSDKNIRPHAASKMKLASTVTPLRRESDVKYVMQQQNA